MSLATPEQEVKIVLPEIPQAIINLSGDRIRRIEQLDIAKNKKAGDAFDFVLKSVRGKIYGPKYGRRFPEQSPLKIVELLKATTIEEDIREGYDSFKIRGRRETYRDGTMLATLTCKASLGRKDAREKYVHEHTQVIDARQINFFFEALVRSRTEAIIAKVRRTIEIGEGLTLDIDELQWGNKGLITGDIEMATGARFEVFEEWAKRIGLMYQTIPRGPSGDHYSTGYLQQKANQFSKWSNDGRLRGHEEFLTTGHLPKIQTKKKAKNKG